jgi:hypothetical protein
MSALTAPFDARRKDGELQFYPVATNTKCFKGGLAVVNASGYVQPAADAASILFVGVFADSADNGNGDTQPGSIAPSIGSPSPNLPSGIAQGTEGAINARVFKEGAYVFGIAAATQANVGAQVYVADDNNVALSGTAHSVVCGYITELIDASHVRVRIDRAVQ